MHVFITGGTGFIGSAIIRELLAAGDKVTGLARTPEAAAKLKEAGAGVVMGGLADLAVLRAAAAEADAVIHTAFIHDFSDYVGAAEADLRAIEALIDGLTANGTTGKAFVSTSGTALPSSGKVGTEEDPGDPQSVAAVRLPAEQAVLAAAKRGVRSGVIRLPLVHGPNDHGFIPVLIDLAKRTGVSAYLGSGDNRVAAVHLDDAAALYHLAMKKLADGSLPAGSVLHAVADSSLTLSEVAQAIAELLTLGPIESREADHFGWLAMFLKEDHPASAVITERLTGWKPTRPGMLADICGPAYGKHDTC